MKTLGIDLSTQSCTLCVFDSIQLSSHTASCPYASLPAIELSPMDKETLLVPGPEGCAEQDPALFLDALEACLEELKPHLPLVSAVQISAQQHGHLYLNRIFAQRVPHLSSYPCLNAALADTYAYPYAPIWRSSDTDSQAEDLRKAAGGKDEMIRLTGSDSPLRFTGAVIKKFADTRPDAYAQSASILLLNTWLACILTGKADIPCDYGNGAGTSLMDYSSQCWDDRLLTSIDPGLKTKLPPLKSPKSIAGTIAPYFQKKYGFSPSCLAGIGTGDNPATKVLAGGDILSLGTSFVYMKNTALNARDENGTANAMFDGLGNPFTIFCRTNGAMVWDKVRSLYGADIPTASHSLAEASLSFPLCLWQPETESLPISPSFPLVRTHSPSLRADYKGIIFSSLTLLHEATQSFGAPESLALTGGPSTDSEILSLAAHIWECPVTRLPQGGAALGAALAALVLADPHTPLNDIRQKITTKDTLNPTPSFYPAFRSHKEKTLKAFRKAVHA